MAVVLHRNLRALGAILLAMLCALSTPVSAQELLLNRSFEAALTPTPANGNNFYTSIPNWSVINVNPFRVDAWNVIRPFSGYAGNPTATPTGGGVLYLDINGASGTITQTVTFPSAGMIDISGWFSVRDFQQALSGLNIRVRNSSNVVVASVSTSILASDPIGTWRQAAGANFPVAAGTYTFEVDMPDFANFDLASLVFKPNLSVTKSGTAYSDPFNGLTNAKQIPGGVTEYAITASSPASYSVTANSLIVIDQTPANLDFVVTDFAGAGSGPAGFTAGTSGLAYTFTSLSSATDDIDFSNNGGTSWTYIPVANANGVDPNVTSVRVRPRNAMAAGTNFVVRLRYRVE